MKKAIYISLGSIFFALGIIGIFLPVLPTTPFLLLTAWFYANSSEKHYERLMNNRYFGNYIRSFREDRAIPLYGKIMALILMWGTVGYTIIYPLSGKWYLQIMLALITLAVTVHILSFKTRKRKRRD